MKNLKVTNYKEDCVHYNPDTKETLKFYRDEDYYVLEGTWNPDMSTLSDEDDGTDTMVYFAEDYEYAREDFLEFVNGASLDEVFGFGS